MSATGSLRVKIFAGAKTDVVVVNKSNATVGRDEHCDVVLALEAVSGEHLRAWLEGGRLWVQDLGSTSGTFLNGIRLPSLKPMLVREIDTLKIGENGAIAVGFEANLVRAPMVKVAAALDEHTPTNIRPLVAKDPELEKRRDELAKVSRELAELKLQLQMQKLEKSSTDELRKQINQLGEELRERQEDRAKLEAGLKKLDQDRVRRISDTEAEISDMKRAAEKHLLEMRESYRRQLEHWKVDAVADLNRMVYAWAQSKEEAWTTRPLSKSGVADVTADLNQIFRRALLTESKSLPETTAAHDVEALIPRTDEPPPLSRTGSFTLSKVNVKTKMQARSDRKRWFAIAGGLVVMAVVLYFAWPFVSRSRVRAPASPPLPTAQSAPTPPAPTARPTKQPR